MPTIVFASPKGGVGKSTAAVLLPAEFASHGGSVTMIDADPNRPLSQWASRPGKPEKLTVIATTTEDSIIDTIQKAALQTTFVIVDLENTASMMAGYAMSRADLVIIPKSARTASPAPDHPQALRADDCPDSLTQAAREAFRRQMDETPGCEYLFPSPRTGTAKPRMTNLRKVWAGTLKRAGVPYFAPYELRHTFATRSSAGGVATT